MGKRDSAEVRPSMQFFMNRQHSGVWGRFLRQGNWAKGHHKDICKTHLSIFSSALCPVLKLREVPKNMCLLYQLKKFLWLRSCGSGCNNHMHRETFYIQANNYSSSHLAGKQRWEFWQAKQRRLYYHRNSNCTFLWYQCSSYSPGMWQWVMALVTCLWCWIKLLCIYSSSEVLKSRCWHYLIFFQL